MSAKSRFSRANEDILSAESSDNESVDNSLNLGHRSSMDRGMPRRTKNKMQMNQYNMFGKLDEMLNKERIDLKDKLDQEVKVVFTSA